MKRTINGYRPNYEHTDKRLDPFDAIDNFDKISARSKDNAKKTIAAMTEETRMKQSNYLSMKANNANIFAENEAKIKANFTDEFIDELVASFEEIGIEQTFKKQEIKEKFAELKESSNLMDKHISNKRKRRMSIYEEILIKIAFKHPDFIVYLPANCFTYSFATRLRLNSLSAEQIEILEKKLTKNGIFNDEMFKKLFLKYFPTHIAEMTTEQASYALSVCPSAFKLLQENCGLRASFEQSPQILLAILRSSPTVLRYLSQKEIALIPANNISIVGYAIKSCPQVLENLPANFFKKHHPKYVIQTIKHEVKEIILNCYDFEFISKKFPELASYFNSPTIVANPSKKNGSIKRIENQGKATNPSADIDF